MNQLKGEKVCVYFGILSVIFFALIMVILYNFGTALEGYELSGDIYGVLDRVKVFNENNYITNKNLRGYSYDEYSDKQIDAHFPGNEILIASLHKSTRSDLFQIVFILSFSYQLLLSLLAFIISYKLFKRIDVALLASFFAVLVPSTGPGHGPLMVLSSSLAFLFLMGYIFSLTDRNFSNYVLTLFFAIGIIITHRPTSQLFYIFIAIIAVKNQLLNHLFATIVGIIIGLLINYNYIEEKLDTELLFSLPPLISIIFFLALLPILFSLSMLHSKITIKRRMEFLSNRYLFYFFMIYVPILISLVAYVGIIAAGSETTSAGDITKGTYYGYIVYGLQTIGGLFIPGVALFIFREKLISKISLFAFILFLGTFLYLLTDISAESTDIKTYARFPIYGAGIATIFIGVVVVKNIRKGILATLFILLLVSGMTINCFLQFANPLVSRESDNEIIKTNYEYIATQLAGKDTSNKISILTYEEGAWQMAVFSGQKYFRYYEVIEYNASEDLNGTYQGYNFYLDKRLPDYVVIPDYRFSTQETIILNEKYLWGVDLGADKYLLTMRNENTRIYMKV